MKAYLQTMRFDHWLKNVFLIFGHTVAVVLALDFAITGKLLMTGLLSLVPVCLIASANYVLNEILDAPFDRLHPTKRSRPLASNRVKASRLWLLFIGLTAAGFLCAAAWFENSGYHIALLLLFLNGLLYNVRPARLKDRAFVDVIAESFNNPIRLWLGWFALVPFAEFPPLSITLAWWSFGGLLMTGKRYAEYRFIDNHEVSGNYRKSFRKYSENSLIIAMITYANLFCFSSGWAVCQYPPLNNLIFVFPLIIVAVMAYFQTALSRKGVRLEPEQMMRRPVIVVCTILTCLLTYALVAAHRNESFRIKEWFGAPDYSSGSEMKIENS